MKHALNIGLENNPETVENIVTTLRVLLDVNLLFRVDIGEYEGKPERTLVVLLNPPNDNMLKDIIGYLASALTQECIAIYNYNDSSGQLVYSPYHRGAVIKFDMKYFVEY
jgi:hypothetical protein